MSYLPLSWLLTHSPTLVKHHPPTRPWRVSPNVVSSIYLVTSPPRKSPPTHPTSKLSRRVVGDEIREKERYNIWTWHTTRQYVAVRQGWHPSGVVRTKAQQPLRSQPFPYDKVLIDIWAASGRDWGNDVLPSIFYWNIVHFLADRWRLSTATVR
jgi:hypothetical protein